MNFSKTNINKQNRDNTLILGYTIFFAILLLTLSFVTSEHVKKTLAVPVMVSDDNMNTNKINDIVIATSVNTRDLINSNNTGIAVNPFYEANGKVISNANTTFPSFNQTAVIVVEKGRINGILNVTNLESWISPSISPTNMLGFGHGVITTMDGQMISWIGYDTNSINEKNGTTIYQGKIFFNNSSSTSNLSSLNNIKGIYITKEYPGTNGNKQTTKMWKIR